jgi:hypothetical protein
MEANLRNFNDVKTIVLTRLLLDKVITEEQAEEYADNWQIIIVKPSWFKRWKEKFQKDSNEYIFQFVRFEN